MKLFIYCIKGNRFTIQSFGEQKIFFINIIFEFIPEKIFIQQVADLDSFPENLVSVTGPDASACCADFLTAFQSSFLVQIKGLVVRHNKMGILTDLESCRRNRQTVLFKFLHLCKKDIRVYDNTVADHTFFVFIKDARGYEMKNKLLPFDHQGMSGIIAPLESDYIVGVTGKKVDNLTFALITPLGAHNNHIGHLHSP